MSTSSARGPVWDSGPENPNTAGSFSVSASTPPLRKIWVVEMMPIPSETARILNAIFDERFMFKIEPLCRVLRKNLLFINQMSEGKCMLYPVFINLHPTPEPDNFGLDPFGN
jgi:hypothetical protein